MDELEVRFWKRKIMHIIEYKISIRQNQMPRFNRTYWIDDLYALLMDRCKIP